MTAINGEGTKYGFRVAGLIDIEPTQTVSGNTSPHFTTKIVDKKGTEYSGGLAAFADIYMPVENSDWQVRVSPGFDIDFANEKRGGMDIDLVSGHFLLQVAGLWKATSAIKIGPVAELGLGFSYASLITQKQDSDLDTIFSANRYDDFEKPDIYNVSGVSAFDIKYMVGAALDVDLVHGDWGNLGVAFTSFIGGHSTIFNSDHSDNGIITYYSAHRNILVFETQLGVKGEF